MNCEFKIEIDTNFTTNIETNFCYNIDANNIKSYLLYYIIHFRCRGYQVFSINQMTIKTFSDRCNMTCGYHLAVERRIIMNIGKNLQLRNSINN